MAFSARPSVLGLLAPLTAAIAAACGGEAGQGAGGEQDHAIGANAGVVINSGVVTVTNTAVGDAYGDVF